MTERTAAVYLIICTFLRLSVGGFNDEILMNLFCLLAHGRTPSILEVDLWMCVHVEIVSVFHVFHGHKCAV